MPTMVVTCNGESGFDSGEGAWDTAYRCNCITNVWWLRRPELKELGNLALETDPGKYYAKVHPTPVRKRGRDSRSSCVIGSGNGSAKAPGIVNKRNPSGENNDKNEDDERWEKRTRIGAFWRRAGSDSDRLLQEEKDGCECERLTHFWLSNACVAANVMVERHPRRKVTWKSPDKDTRNQVDHLLVPTGWMSSVTGCRAPGADSLKTDHSLVASTLRRLN